MKPTLKKSHCQCQHLYVNVKSEKLVNRIIACEYQLNVSPAEEGMGKRSFPDFEIEYGQGEGYNSHAKVER